MNAPMPNLPNVYQRLNAARNVFHSLKLKKTGHNKFAGYYYFELGDFLIPALKVFSDNGLFACVSFDADKASMTIRNTDNPADLITIYSPMGSAALKGCHEVQNIGAVETYQRRYLWVAALEIVEHDALDSSKPLDDKPAKATKPPVKAALEGVQINEEDMAYLRELASELVHRCEVDNHVADAYDAVQSAMLDHDQTLQLWEILAPNSKTRSALKKEGEARRAAAKAPLTEGERLAGVV